MGPTPQTENRQCNKREKKRLQNVKKSKHAFFAEPAGMCIAQGETYQKGNERITIYPTRDIQYLPVSQLQCRGGGRLQGGFAVAKTYPVIKSMMFKR
jgi:hypothetical protein